MPNGKGVGRKAPRRLSSSSGWFLWGCDVLGTVFVFASVGDANEEEAVLNAALEVGACPQFPQKRALSGNSNPQK